MTDKIIRYATARFEDGTAIESTIKWHDGTLADATRRVREYNGAPICALLHYQDIKDDVPGTFFPKEMNATREEFESHPDAYGVCYYHQPFTGGTYVYE